MDLMPENERPILIVLGENLERYRKEKGMSKKKLCEEADFTYQQYNKLITGEASTRIDTLQRFAYALDIKTIDLIEDWSE